jgi:hypothetical protein
VNAAIAEDLWQTLATAGLSGVTDDSLVRLVHVPAMQNGRTDATAIPVNIAIWGDSLTTGLIPRTGERMLGYKIMPAWRTSVTGTITDATGSEWISGTWQVFADGASCQIRYNTTTDWEADRCGLAYITGPAGGTMRVETSIDGGSTWQVASAGVDTYSAAAGGGYAEFAISNALRLPARMRLTNISGDGKTVKIIGGGLWLNNNSGYVLSHCNLSGLALTTTIDVPAATVSGVMAGLKPHMIATCWDDDPALWEPSGAFDTMVSRIEAGYADIDWVLISANPPQPDTGLDPLDQIAKQKAWALANNQSFVDGYHIFRSWAEAVALGWHSGDTRHLTANGNARRNFYIEQLLNGQPLAGSQVEVSRKAAIHHNGTDSGRVEIGRIDPDNSGTGGLFIRGGVANTAIILGNRNSTSASMATVMSMSGAWNALTLSFDWASSNDHLTRWTVSGTASTGTITNSSAWPLVTEMKAPTDGSFATAPSAGSLKFGARITGGKMELCVRFPTGAVHVLATEP